MKSKISSTILVILLMSLFIILGTGRTVPAKSGCSNSSLQGSYGLHATRTITGGPLAVAPVYAVSSVRRPISDFLSAQGTTAIFVPPVPDYVGWFAPNGPSASVDYAGLANQWLKDNGLPSGLGTTTEGTITERPLSDGRAEVSVLLHTKKALTYVIQCCDFATDPLLFGHRAQDVATGADAALGESFLHVVFKNTAPGAPLPDLVTFISGNTAPGQELISISFHAGASGTLRAAFGVPDGTPGKAIVAQTGLFRTAFKGATADGFPAELVELRVVGR
jgi:hypothetical protein